MAQQDGQNTIGNSEYQDRFLMEVLGFLYLQSYRRIHESRRARRTRAGAGCARLYLPSCTRRNTRRRRHGPVPMRISAFLPSTLLATCYSIPLASNRAPPANTMSQVSPTATSSEPPNFETIFTAALKAYKKKTKKDIASHPLATQLQFCDSPHAILAVLRSQVQIFGKSQSVDEKWTKWLDPTVNVISSFSSFLNVAGPVNGETSHRSGPTL